MSAEPEFPDRVKIGYTRYVIEQWTPRSAAAARRFGEISYTERVIRIDRQHGPLQAADTLMHEIVHGLKDASAVRHKDALDDEEMTTTVAAGLTQVMSDNPAVREWFAWAWGQTDG